MWVKPPNSGDSLKLLVPSDGTVISQKMIENEMGYRGSKSVALILDTLFVSEKPSSVAVKEQRVDGN
ncbi:hypothetical protein GcM1_250025 [Golovinomyces cichoracearum]|uniref:Uncharacterized protein n=1 Tax=Golovinomyces cichoracearum TaxID=62708 RepID=A0A420IF39_9PEZI|nr:hypothetical protein GcM1_250025 [Golovinomyces cichoracearum]RKF73137.1 hypothetical protein GcM3_095011 [Golovinomyces cichoracearum]